MTSIHPSQLHGIYAQYRTSIYGSWSLAAVALLLLGLGASVKHPALKAVCFAGVVGSTLSARPLRRQVYRLDGFARDWEDTGDDAFQKYLYDQMNSKQAVLQLAPAQGQTTTPELFDWHLFNTKPDKYPHIALVGSTGDGKSTMAEWMATWLTGRTIAIAPHAKPGDFPSIPCYCSGRNYGSKDDEAIDFQDLLDGNVNNPSAVAVLKCINAEMDRRYKLRDKGQSNFEQVNFIIDECNTMLDKIAYTSDILVELLREARKVGIRLILLLQSPEVEALKVKGRGSVRKCLVFCYLGEFALEQAGKLKDEVITRFVEGQEYPLMVRRTPAVTPDLSLINLGSRAGYKAGSIPVTAEPIPDSGTSPEPTSYQGGTDSALGSEILKKALLAHLQNGKSRTWVVKKVLGYQGRKLKEGQRLLESLIAD